MRALVWHGTQDIRCDTVPDPEIEDDRDAIIKVTACAICGSDLHLYDHVIPAMKKGDILGHEFMGEVVETGRGLNGTLKKGERVKGTLSFERAGRVSVEFAVESLAAKAPEGKAAPSGHDHAGHDHGH